MSVILFSKNQVYQEMADAYEDLKHVLPFSSDREVHTEFYKSLRRMYFANVATWLCQYHAESPLPEQELLSIDTFQELEGNLTQGKKEYEALNDFIHAWDSLKYNTYTNDGEQYIAKDAYQFIDNLVIKFSTEVIDRMTKR